MDPFYNYGNCRGEETFAWTSSISSVLCSISWSLKFWLLMYLYTLSLFFLQIKRKLPKVNRVLAARLLENEEAETVNNDTVDADTKKKLKKKKGLTSEVMKDERFEAMFKNEVLDLCI